MKYSSLFLIFTLLTCCEEEVAIASDLDFVNTQIFIEGNIQAGSEIRAISIEQGGQGSISNVDGYEPGLNGFSRDGNSSLVAYIGKLFIGSEQRNNLCYKIEPLVWGQFNHLADETRIALTPTFFLEFPGLSSQDPNCRIDSSDIAFHLRLGEYFLGQQENQAHIHLYSHGLFTNAENIPATDFYLSPSTENQGLSLIITELDYESANYIDDKGVFVSFEVPLAKGYNSYSGTLYKIFDLRGRLFFPFE